MKMKELHRRALEATRKYFQAKAELLELLQEIDACKGFRNLGYTSLFSYAVEGLKLSESTALNLINVARKAVQVPALKTEIQSGNLSVSKARKIVPVLTIQNQAEWIEKAKTLPTRKLEKEIAKIAPMEAFSERVRYATENRVNLSLSLDEKILEQIKRAQDLESQRTGRAVTLEKAMAAMAAAYLEKNDPVEKAKRAVSKTSSAAAKTSSTAETSDDSSTKAGPKYADVTVTYDMEHARHTSRRRESTQLQSAQPLANSSKRRNPIPTMIEHEISLRDGAQCTAIDQNGKRCERRRWLHVHHVIPVSESGQNTLENLTTLCSAHHQMRHEQEGSRSLSDDNQ